MAGKFTNNASSKLAGSISAAATSISVTSGGGVLFPILGAGDWCRLTLVKLVGGLEVLEIVKATARTGDIFTIVRAQEGTTATTFTAGDKVDCRITAAGLADFAPLDSPAFTNNPTAPTQLAADDTTKLATTAFANRAAATAAGKITGPTAVLTAAATVNIGAADVGNISITGTATISAFDTVAEGTLRWVVFAAALTLTYHATAMQLPGAASIVTTPDDAALFKSLGGGNWKCLYYQRASGTGPVAASATKSGYLSSADWAVFNAKQTALGFTPYNASNPAGYISGITSSQVTTALGFTPQQALGFTAANAAGQAFSGNISAPVVTQTSDERKKRNWRALTDDQLDALANMELAGLFDWNDGGTSLGGSAQEIARIVPQAVHEDEHGDLTVNYGGLCFAVQQATLRRLWGTK